MRRVSRACSIGRKKRSFDLQLKTYLLARSLAWRKPWAILLLVALFSLFVVLAEYKYVCHTFVCSLQQKAHDQDVLHRFSSLQTQTEANAYDVSAPTGPWSRAFFINSTTVAAVLLRPVSFQTDLANAEDKRCRLGPLAGRITLVHDTGESHEHSWDAAIVYCQFDQLSLADVYLQYTLIRLPLGASADMVYTRRPDRHFKLTVCVPPVYGRLRYQWVKEWFLVYREYIGVDHTFIYSYMRELRHQLTKAGINRRWTPFSVMDMYTQTYGQFYRGQLTSIYDCLFFNRYLKTEWTLFQDLDEVLWLPPRWTSLVHFLSENEKRIDTVTFGMWYADITFCYQRTDDVRTYIDRINVFFKGPFCGEMCECWKGGRKYAAKPSRAERLNVHFPNSGLQPDLRVLDLNVSDGFLRHYRAVADLDIEPRPCSAVSRQRQLRTDRIPFPEFTNPRPMHDWQEWLPC